MNQQPQAKQKPTRDMRIIKVWEVEEAKFIYMLQRRFEASYKVGKNEVTVDEWRIAANVKMDEEKAKANAEHYGIEVPTEEFDEIGELEAHDSELEALGL